ncbi:hypothetical protein, partial [Heyndrickxia coagulans]|uniref:hypothetical protein n=1 Tax=Heyndrickxia coagulans TaxID=1398 RepID=UPI001F21B75F
FRLDFIRDYVTFFTPKLELLNNASLDPFIFSAIILLKINDETRYFVIFMRISPIIVNICAFHVMYFDFLLTWFIPYFLYMLRTFPEY